jgi:hypothetical protein
MPIFNEIPQSVPKVPEPTPVIQTSTVYQEPTAEIQTGTQLEGTPWTVNYYSQILGRDDYPNRLDMALDPSLQQYVKVQDMTILLDGDLSGSKDEQQIGTLTGTAKVYPGIPVNQWDMFVARIPDGRLGVFTVIENPQPANLYSYSAHEITFELVAILTSSYQFELDRKTIDTLYFDPSNPTCPGKNAVAVADVLTIKRALTLLLDMLYDEYYDLLTRTLILRVDGSKYYDSSAVDFIRRILSYNVRGRRPQIQGYTTPTGEYSELYKTIWDVLSDNSTMRWDVITDKSAVIRVDSFHSPFILNGIAMTDIIAVIHPGDAGLMWSEIPESEKTLYVFSEAFYKHDYANMETHEQWVYTALNNELYDVKLIIDNFKTLKTLTHIDRFYMILTYYWLLLRRL